MSIRRRYSFALLSFFLAASFFPSAAAQDRPIPRGQDIANIQSPRTQARLWNEWLAWRLENILPEIMRREHIDLWLVINREYNEDPVYLTLVPASSFSARRTSILVFHDLGPGQGVERLSASFFGAREWYKPAWKDKKILQFENLARLIKEIDPRRIGIDVAPDWAFGDGLSASLKERLISALGPELSSRLVSAERLCLGWLERRSPQELSLYRHISGVGHDLIAEFFSNRVIIPDVTSTEDVEWWIRLRIAQLGLETWFSPSIDIIRNTKAEVRTADRTIIRRGDILHCDVGLKYCGLCTDMQWHAYVLRTGEADAPDGLKEALLRARGTAEIFMAEFQAGRTGFEIQAAAMAKAKAAGLRPLLYSHPLGFHGHAAGCIMEARPPEQAPEGSRVQMEYPLYPDTVYAIEFSSTTSVPEWGGQDVAISYEETAAFTAEGCRFLDGCQTAFLLMRCEQRPGGPSPTGSVIFRTGQGIIFAAVRRTIRGGQGEASGVAHSQLFVLCRGRGGGVLS